MTDLPADPGAPGSEAAVPSEPPVVRRSNYAPPPPGAEPPRFDDDALAEAMAAEVSSYTQPITLPKSPAAAQPVAAPPAEPVAAPPVEPVAASPVEPAAAPPVEPAAVAFEAPVEPPVEPSRPTSPVGWDGVPLNPVAPDVPIQPSSEPSVAESSPSDDELLRAWGGASTLEAIERLENELRLLSSGEIPTIDLSQTQQSAAVEDAAPPANETQTDPEPLPGEPEPALDHPAPGHFFPAIFEPIAAEASSPDEAPSEADLTEAAAQPATAQQSAPPLPEVDESLIDPAAAAELSSSVSAPENRWWDTSDSVDGAWDVAAAASEPLPASDEAPAREESSAEPVDPVVAQGVRPVPISTEPPVGPEAPDWLDAPPPTFQPPELVEPVSPEPIAVDAMAQLPKPLPTDQPKLEDRAELPPPPGYDNIPIMWDEVAAAPPPVAPNLLSPPMPEAASIAEAPPFLPSTPIFGATAPANSEPPEATETSDLDHDEDDVIDEIDRVSGARAIPISALGTAEPMAPPSEPIATVRLSEGEPALVDEKPQLPSAFEVEAAGPEPTALDLRAGRAARLFWLWFAANSSVLSLGLGAVLLGTGMSLRQAIVAALAGVAISFLPLGLGTLAGKWSGQPTMIVSRATFGHAGNILPALLAIATRVLWGGVLLWLLSTAVAQVLVGSGLDAGLGTTVWQLVGLVVGFVIATVIAVFGYGFVAKLQLVLSIANAVLIVGAAALTAQHVNFTTALTVPDGSWILVISGAALVFSVVGLAWVHSSSDLARYQRPASNGGSSMLWATFGATLPPFALIAWGAMLAASDPALAKGLTSNPLAAIATLLPAWYPAPLLAAAALGLLSGAVLTTYSGGFALQAIGVRARRSFATFVSAILVLVTAAALIFMVTDFGSLIRDLVITVAVPVAAWAGIFASEMMIRTRRFHAPSLLAPGGLYPQVRWLNFIAMIIISVIGLGLVTSSIPGLSWEGFLYGALGLGPHDVMARSDVGVFVALLLGIVVPLAGGVPAIRRQERSPITGVTAASVG